MKVQKDSGTVRNELPGKDRWQFGLVRQEGKCGRCQEDTLESILVHASRSVLAGTLIVVALTAAAGHFHGHGLSGRDVPYGYTTDAAADLARAAAAWKKISQWHCLMLRTSLESKTDPMVYLRYGYQQ